MTTTLRGLINRRLSFLSDQPLLPLSILFCITLLMQLDRAALMILAPEIRAAFGLSPASFGRIAGLASAIGLMAGVPLGVLGDRMSRTKVAAGAAVLWGVMLALTGWAHLLWFLLWSVVGSAIARASTWPLHTSLLSDYHPPPVQGRIFALHRAGGPLALMLAPVVAGSLASLLGDWRRVFLVLAILSFVAAAASLKLRHPDRGETENFVLAAAAAFDKPAPFARAATQLLCTPTLWRTYLSLFFGGGAVFALFNFLSIFFFEVFGAGAKSMGFISAGNGFFQLLGTVAGGFVADRMRRRSLAGVAVLSGAALALSAPGVLLAAISESFAVSVAGSFLAFLAAGAWTAPALCVLSAVTPARMRSLGIGLGTAAVGVGGLVASSVTGWLMGGPGLRAGLASLFPIMVLGGFIAASSRKSVDADADAALQSLAAEVELAQQRIDSSDHPPLSIRGLNISSGETSKLLDVNLEIHRGELVAILGDDEDAKTALLDVLSGGGRFSGGAVLVDGNSLSSITPETMKAAGILRVGKGAGIVPGVSIGKHIEVAVRHSSKARKASKRSIAEVKRLFPWMLTRWDSHASSISENGLKMVELALALVSRPKVLVVDGVVTGQTHAVARQLLDIVRAISRTGTPVILREASSDLMLRFADRAYVVTKGRVERFKGSTRGSGASGGRGTPGQGPNSVSNEPGESK